MVRILGSTGTRRRRTWLALGTVAALTLLAIPATSFADFGAPTYCDFVQVDKKGGVTELCQAPLTDVSTNNSTFAAGDGNLQVPNASGSHDWQNVGIICPATAGSGTGCGADPLTGSTDNSFGQGTKEDDPAVSIVTGSIPPNKSDLTRFYESSETVGTGATAQTYLYLAWERTNVLGSANMDFEINALAQPDMTGAGPVTLNRSPGDLLVTYDFTNGGGKPVLGLNRWLLSASNPSVPGFSTNVCLSSNSFPCWGDHLTLSGTISEGATNNRDAVTDPIPGFNACPGGVCPASTFGEAGINLTGAGVFSSTRCTTFSSAFLKSRASASFPAEVKDFVAPIPTEISNCGEVTVIKHTIPRGVNQDFTYDWNVTGTTTSDLSSSACPTGTAAFTLNDNGNSSADSPGNTENCFNVVAGSSYTVTEQPPPTGFVFTSVVDGGSTGGASCTQSGSTRTANITVTVGGHAICLYTNTQQLGAIKITKTAKNKTLGSGDQPQSGVTFTIAGAGGPYTVVTNSNGVACQDGLAFGSYTVTETVPTGYQADSTNPQTVSVGTNATCGSGNEAPATFHNTPLSQIRVTYHSKAGVGVTTATIQCTGEASAVDLPDGLTGTGHNLDDLVPGTYTCTVIIDP